MNRLIQESKENKPNSDLLDYKKALRLIQPNPELEDALNKDWILLKS